MTAKENRMSDPPLPTSPVTDQPLARITRDGVEYTLLGTAHVSRASVEAVRELIGSQDFDAIAVELCDTRYRALRDREAWRNLDLLQIIRQGKAGMVAANLALSAYQRRLAEQFGIEPGAEMKTAAELAEAQHKPVWLIDREVATTLKRAYRSVGFLARFGLLGGLVASLFERGDVAEEDIEKLKQGDMLQSAFSEFAEQSEPLFRSLIAERDGFMSARLREESAKAQALGTMVKRVLVVIGAGHLAGMTDAIQTQQDDPTRCTESLNMLPPASPWPRWIGFGVLAVIVAAIAYTFTRGAHFGVEAIKVWVLFTGGFAALGALLGGGHILSALTAFVVGPLKPFRPFVPVGAVAAAVEMSLRRPRVADFESLRDDVIDWRGWWKNRVSRTLLVFLLSNFGMILGEYLAGIRILSKLL
ncbi:MAG: TraB/GumN family protein [Proteobacteria bacterium]|nr:TraB/GumN family protein [Pseudomonadota bacterium]